MSTPWTIAANDQLFTVVTDVITTGYWVVITGAVTDEILGNFDAPGFVVGQLQTDLAAKAAGQGLYAISGYPARSFPHLDSTSYTVTYTLRAPGFRDYPTTANIPVSAVFPVAAPSVAMRRLPVRLQGRVVADATGVPVPGALIVSVDNPIPPISAQHSMLLRSPLYSPHPINATAQQVTLASAGSTALKQPAVNGTTTLILNSTAGLSGAAFVQIATPSKTLVEYALVASLGPAPGQVQLKTPLNRSYATGAATNVNFVTATPTGTAAKLLTDTNSGDGILVADTLLTASTLVIDAGNPTEEYHEAGAVSDSNGYYGFDGVGRVRELFLQANATGTPVPWVIEFDQTANVVDFRI